jgi:hypothetical protein
MSPDSTLSPPFPRQSTANPITLQDVTLYTIDVPAVAVGVTGKQATLLSLPFRVITTNLTECPVRSLFATTTHQLTGWCVPPDVAAEPSKGPSSPALARA